MKTRFSANRRRTIALLCVVGVLGLLGWWLTWMSTEEPLLMERATRVATLPPRSADYRWESNGTVLICSFGRQQLLELDTRTHASTQLLDQAIRPDPNFMNFSLSPDHRYALWGSLWGNGANITSADLSGGTTSRISVDQSEYWIATNPIWLSDNVHVTQIVQSTSGAYALIAARDNRGDFRRVPIDFPADPFSGFNLGGLRLMGVTQNGAIIAVREKAIGSGSTLSAQRLTFFEIDLRGARGKARQYSVLWPMQARSVNAAYLNEDPVAELSPRGDRLAWIGPEDKEQQPVLLWLSKWVRGIDTNHHHWIKVSTSSLDGTDFRVIGRFETERHRLLSSVYSYPSLDRLQWLPSGRRLSFCYDGALWTVPVDR